MQLYPALRITKPIPRQSKHIQLHPQMHSFIKYTPTGSDALVKYLPNRNSSRLHIRTFV